MLSRKGSKGVFYLGAVEMYLGTREKEKFNEG